MSSIFEESESGLPDTTFETFLSQRLWIPGQGDGSPLGDDPKHLAGLHTAVEHLLFRDSGQPPYSDLLKPSEQIRKHLRSAENGRYTFGEWYRLVLETLLYGKAVFSALRKPLRLGEVEAEFEAVPGPLREVLLDRPMVIDDWLRMTLFRKALRTAWFNIRGETLKPGLVYAGADFKAHDVSDFVHRAMVFIVDDFERHIRPGVDFYELAKLGVGAYERWQDLLIAQAKVTSTPESRAAHTN